MIQQEAWSKGGNGKHDKRVAGINEEARDFLNTNVKTKHIPINRQPGKRLEPPRR